MRRWSYRILFGLGIAIVALVVIVQIVLWTPLPKQIVIQQIEHALGLRISADKLSTGWLGKTELTNVSLGLPLSNGDFLKVKSLKIQHSSLIALALGNIEVDSIDIEDPTVQVVQDANGQWNLQQVIELLGRLGAGTSAQNQPQDNSIPKLPNIKLANGTVHILDNQNHSVDLNPVNVTGQSNGPLVWDYKLSVADAISMDGKLAPGGNWQHEISLSIQNLDSLVKNWGVSTTYSAVVKANLSGQISDGKWVGNLSLGQAAASNLPGLGDVGITGAIDAEINGNVITVRPKRVDLKTTNVTLPNLRIEAGIVVYDAAGFHAKSVKLNALGGRANLDGSYDPLTSAADVTASWSGLSLAKQTSQSGSFTAKLREPFVGQPVITAELTDNGSAGSPNNRWNATLNLSGQGRSWQAIDWVLTAPQLTCTTGDKSVDLSQLSAHISQHLPIVELTSFALPGNTTATGQIDFSAKKWHFDAAGGFNTTYQGTPVPMTIELHTMGTDKLYQLKSLVLGAANLTITADGSYDAELPEPVDLHVLLAQTPRIAPESPVQGEISGEFKIVGVLFKEQGRLRPYLTTTGDLRSSDLVLFNRPVGDIDVKLRGDTATPNLPGGEPGPSITDIHTVDFKLFQAPWDLSIHYPNADGSLEASLQTSEVELEELAKFAKVKGITGQLVSAKWNAVIPASGFSGMVVSSEYHLSEVNAGGFIADTVDANAALNRGVLKLNPLVIRNGAGTITTTASLDLLNTHKLTTQTTVDRWPYPVSDSVSALVSAHSNLDFDLKAKDLGATGTVTASTDLVLGASTRLAHAELNASVLNRAISIDQLNGNILTGTFNGVAKFDLDKPLMATGQVVWSNLDGAAMAAVFPELDGMGGKFSGTITLAPARDPRPLEPVRLDVNVASTDGHFRSLQIGGNSLLTMHAVGYLNTDRAVLDHSDIYLAGGTMHVWGRVGYRPGTRLATQLVVDFQNFQLDQLAHIDAQITKPLPGILSGHIGLIRSGPHASQVLAMSHISLSQTDLGNFGPIAALYSVMNVGGGPSAGDGSVDLAFEQNTLRVTDFSYFNQGIEARGICSLGPINYENLADTKLDGQVVGTARPLKDTRLPFLGDFDQVFSALQGGLTTINLTGTPAHPTYRQALVTDIGKTLRQLLVGEAEAGNGE